MDLATRKRFLSASVDVPNAKIAATTAEQPPGFADVMFIHLLNALSSTEHSQRVPLLDEIIARVQWLKQYHQQSESNGRKLPSPEKSLMSPPHPVEHRPIDHQKMKNTIQKDQERLANMSKLINYFVQPPQPTHVFTPPTAPPPPARVPEVEKKTPMPPPPAPPPPVTVPPPVRPAPTTPPPPPKVAAPKKTDPTPPQQQSTQQLIPSKQLVQSTEEMLQEIQQRQKKLLTYISSAHNGKVTNEVLHDYLRHPIVKLSENGVVREEFNPFFYLMSQPPGTGVPAMMPPHPMAMMPPAPVNLSKTSKPPTPIPAPPVLVAQVEIPPKKESATPQKAGTQSPPEKVSPPPRLPPQLPLQIIPQVPSEPKKQFENPVTRQCNQWSVFSMALPLK